MGEVLLSFINKYQEFALNYDREPKMEGKKWSNMVPLVVMKVLL